MDVTTPGTVTNKSKKPVPPTNFKEPQKFDPSNVSYSGTLGKKGLEDMKRRREEREKHGSSSPKKPEEPKSSSFKYQDQDFKKDKKGKWVPTEEPKAAKPLPAPEQPKVSAPSSTPEQPKVTAPAPEQPKAERWADVRKRLGYSARQSVTSDPKLLAAYNKFKEKQSLAAETEYKGELIENPIRSILSATSKRGLGSIQKLLSRLKKPKGGKVAKGALAKRLITRAGLSKAAIGIGSIILNRLLQGGSGYSKSEGSSLTTKSSPTQLHVAKNIGEGYMLPEAIEPSKKARKDVEGVRRTRKEKPKTTLSKDNSRTFYEKQAIKSLDT